MIRIPIPFIIVISCFACISCGSPSMSNSLQGNFYSPRYAHGFCIDTAKGSKIITIANPFQKNEQQQYTYIITQPLERVVCMSTTHIGFLDAIDKIDAVVGVSDAKYVYNQTLHNAYDSGRISSVGYDAAVTIEKIIKLHPDAVLAYGIYNEFEHTAQKLQELNIRVIYIGEYVETHPLGKAEWLIAFASMFGVEEHAKDIFSNIENEYLALTKLIPDDVHRTLCLLNAPWNDAWFMPCASSNMAQYLYDAGGTSAIALRNNCESFPESIENVYAMSQNAECWLNAGNATTLQALSMMHKLIAEIPVFASGRVYNHNKRCNQWDGNDFFESGAIAPHLILKDLIHILHPEILPQHKLYYYAKMK